MAVKRTDRTEIAARRVRPDRRLRAPGAPGAPGGALAIRYIAQTEDNWCWAACAAMLFTRPGETQSGQCDIASTHLGRTCCPSPHAPSACNQGAWPHLAYPPLGIPTTFIQAPLSRQDLQAQLAAGRPVEVCYLWSGGSSTHVALIVGENGSGDFEVFDPSYGAGSRSFSQIASAYGLGSWLYSFTF
jgi:Papain-like cysteine protease AvrRpt2